MHKRSQVSIKVDLRSTQSCLSSTRKNYAAVEIYSKAQCNQYTVGIKRLTLFNFKTLPNFSDSRVGVAFHCSFDLFYVLVRGKQYRARERKQKDNGTDQIFPTESIERYEKNHIPELQNFAYHLQLKACLPPSHVCFYT